MSEEKKHVDYEDIIKDLRRQLAEANDKLTRIGNLCPNCTNLSDAQAIAGGQKLDYITDGCFNCDSEKHKSQLAEEKSLRMSEKAGMMLSYNAMVDAKDKEIARLKEGLKHIAEYWNQSDNERAVADALREIVETTENLLKDVNP